MGISLQMYRSCIGSFNCLHKAHHFNKRLSTNQVSSSGTKPCLVVVLIFSIFFSTVVYQAYYEKVTSLPPQRPLAQNAKLQSQFYSEFNRYIEEYTPLPHSTHYWLTKRDRNLLAKITYGNRRDRGLKVLHWNKGPSFLHSKHTEIETIIESHKPHIFGLSEANLWKNHDPSLSQHPDYQLHTCSTAENPDLGVSRVVVYTHNSVVVKRRADLENNTISSIWLEVGLPNKRRILMCHAYREWRHLNQENNSSASIGSQLERWVLFLDQWERALLEDKEVLVAMDANIDFLKWTKSNLAANDGPRNLKPLIEALFGKIFPHGVCQMVTVATRMWSGQAESGLDHLYTNRPDKISDVYAEYTGGSDHKLIKVTRYSKSIKNRVRYVRKRCYKDFNKQEFSNKVKELSWYDVYTCEDTNQAAYLLTTKLLSILDHMAPVRTVQCRRQYAPWLSSNTKELMKERDKAQKLAASTGNMDHWRDFKNKRNGVTARLWSGKKSWEKERLSNTDNNPQTLWKNMKGWLNWKSSGPPSQLFSEGRIVNSPADLADTMNKFFTNKVVQLRQGIPANGSDPLKKS